MSPEPEKKGESHSARVSHVGRSQSKLTSQVACGWRSLRSSFLALQKKLAASTHKAKLKQGPLKPLRPILFDIHPVPANDVVREQGICGRLHGRRPRKVLCVACPESTGKPPRLEPKATGAVLPCAERQNRTSTQSCPLEETPVSTNEVGNHCL